MVIYTWLYLRNVIPWGDVYMPKDGSNDDERSRRAFCHWTFLRQIDLALACIGALEIALDREDRDRVSAILISLHSAWVSADAVIEQGKLDLGFVESFARDALQSTRDMATRSLVRASELFATLTARQERPRDN